MKKILLILFIILLTPLFSDEHLSNEEKESVKYVVESEKLSRDMYLKLYEIWELEIFNASHKIDITHFNAIKLFAINEKIVEEGFNGKPGVYSSPYFNRLYKDFSETANKSFYDALYVAATMEEMAIFDIMEYEVNTKNKELAKLLLDLKYGAMGNLRKLNKEILKYGVSYEGKYLEPALLKRILGQ